MKKTIITIALLAMTILAHAEEKAKADTTAISGNIRFYTEQWTSTTGKVKTSTTATYNGKVYPSNKTSEKRASEILRHGGTPCYAIIRRNEYARIVVL